MIYFYDIPPLPDASYFFNVLLVNIYIRRSLQKNNKKTINFCQDLRRLMDPRPVVYQLFAMDDELFEKEVGEEEKFFIDFCPHCVVEMSLSCGISFFSMIKDEEEEEEEENLLEEEKEEDEKNEIDFFDPEDFWRL